MLKYYAQIRLLISVILSSLWSLYTWNEVEDEVDDDEVDGDLVLC